MGRYRLQYLIIIIALAIAAFITESNAFIISIVALICIAIFLKIFMLVSVLGLSIKLSAKESAKAGNSLNINLKYIRKINFFAQGILVVKVLFYNKLYDIEKEVQYIIPLNKRFDSVKLSFKPEFCGNLNVKFKSIAVSDVLGLFERKIKLPKDINIVVYPNSTGIVVNEKENRQKYLDGDETMSVKIGNDNTDIFGIRDYRQGDSLHSIHWKLSAKLDDLVIKEKANSLNFDTLLFIDLGLMYNNNRLKNKYIQSVIDAGLSLGDSMLDSDIKFDIMIPTIEDVYLSSVDFRDTYYNCIDEIMSISPSSDCNKWIDYHCDSMINWHYGRIIFVVWNEYPSILAKLSQYMDIIVVILYSNEKNRESIDNQGLNVVSININDLYNKEHIINV